MHAIHRHGRQVRLNSPEQTSHIVLGRSNASTSSGFVLKIQQKSAWCVHFYRS